VIIHQFILFSKPNNSFEGMNRIKEVLQEKGIKQVWLSEKLEKSFNMVNEYCNNKRQPSLEDLNRIAEILDIDVRLLIQSNKEK
jgi:transcriptional regulator with XRE-family HTH domain